MLRQKKLDDFNFKNVSFVKIDVEGHELKLLKGSKIFFLKNKPDCLIEIKKKNLPKVKNFFKKIDSKYRCISKKNLSFRLMNENYLFSKNY